MQCAIELRTLKIAKEPLEFAFVRRNDDRGLARLYCGEKSSGLAGRSPFRVKKSHAGFGAIAGIAIARKRCQRIGVEHDGGGRFQDRQYVRNCFGSDGSSRSDEHGIAADVAKEFLKSLGARDGAYHDRLTCAALIAVDAVAPISVTRPAPIRNAPRAPSRAAPACCGGPDTMTA